METATYSWLGDKVKRLVTHELNKSSVRSFLNGISGIVTDFEANPSTGSILEYMTATMDNAYLTGAHYFVSGEGRRILGLIKSGKTSDLVPVTAENVLTSMEALISLPEVQRTSAAKSLLELMFAQAQRGMSGVPPFLTQVSPQNLVNDCMVALPNGDYGFGALVPLPHFTIGQCEGCLKDHRVAILSTLATPIKRDPSGETVLDMDAEARLERLDKWDGMYSVKGVSNDEKHLKEMLSKNGRVSRKVLNELKATELLKALDETGDIVNFMTAIDWRVNAVVQAVLIRSVTQSKSGVRINYKSTFICRGCASKFNRCDDKSRNGMFMVFARNIKATSSYLVPQLARNSKDASGPRKTVEKFMRILTDKTTAMANQAANLSSVSAGKGVFTESETQKRHHFSKDDKEALAKDVIEIMGETMAKTYVYMPPGKKGRPTLKKGTSPSLVRKVLTAFANQRVNESLATSEALFGGEE